MRKALKLHGTPRSPPQLPLPGEFATAHDAKVCLCETNMQVRQTAVEYSVQSTRGFLRGLGNVKKRQACREKIGQATRVCPCEHGNIFAIIRTSDFISARCMHVQDHTGGISWSARLCLRESMALPFRPLTCFEDMVESWKNRRSGAFPERGMSWHSHSASASHRNSTTKSSGYVTCLKIDCGASTQARRTALAALASLLKSCPSVRGGSSCDLCAAASPCCPPYDDDRRQNATTDEQNADEGPPLLSVCGGRPGQSTFFASANGCDASRRQRRR